MRQLNMYADGLLGTSQTVWMLISLKKVLGIYRYINGAIAPIEWYNLWDLM